MTDDAVGADFVPDFLALAQLQPDRLFATFNGAPLRFG